MKFRHLLAKSAEDPLSPLPAQTVVGHTVNVLSAADAFVSSLAAETVVLIGDSVTTSQWETAITAAAWLHDLGKANDHFQRAVRDRSFRQGVRHETLGFVVAGTILDDWLAPLWAKLPDWMRAGVLFAVGGHHLKFPSQQVERGHPEVAFLGSHSQFTEVLRIGAERFGLNTPPVLTDQTFGLLRRGLFDDVLALGRTLDREFTPAQKVFVAALKATLLCADAAGSALPAKGLDTREWLLGRLRPVLTDANLEGVVQSRLKGSAPRPFQERVRSARGNTVLVTAGCGSGKTAAAYLWAADRAKGRRLFFCYPTTATASAGFSGYLRDPDFDATLIHSRSVVDYRLLEGMPAQTDEARLLQTLQLESFDTWPTPAVVCTAHTVLGLLQNVRTGIYAWPSLVRAAFVFDEVHAYPDRLFSHLLRFLAVFRTAPVLLMTATLPPHRRKALEAVAIQRGGLVEVTGPVAREEAPRYELHRSDEEDAWQEVAEVLDKGGKVLWVCNQVARAVAVARRALDLGFPVAPFHSRYRYRDRVARQNRLVSGFEPATPALLGVTTQVAEMSLDLSADLLVTEYAPPADLIQRMGRLNRRADCPADIGRALFLRPENALPYAKKDAEDVFWSQVEGWLDTAADGTAKSQRELADAFLSCAASADADQSLFCDWLDDPWRSQRNRQALVEPGYTIEVVREEDLGAGRPGEIAVPVPVHWCREWARWEFQGHYLKAPAGAFRYDEFWGAEHGREELDAWVI